jgi:hypothetical protein
MPTRKLAKRQVGVTGKSIRREKAAREWRSALLVRLLDFAANPIDDVQKAREEISDVIGKSISSSYNMSGRPDPAELEAMRAEIQKRFEQTIRGEHWWVPLENVRREVIPGYVAQYAGKRSALLPMALADLLGSPAARRLQRCPEPECGKIFVRRKQGRYCREHGSGKERARRRRRNLREQEPLAARRARRRGYYKARIAKTKGSEAASKIKGRPISANELMIDAIEAVDREAFKNGPVGGPRGKT